MIPTILLTGFGPFGENQSNPSQSVCQRVAQIVPEAAYRLHTLVLPVSYRRCPEMLVEALERLQPAAVLSLGLAASAQEIAIERFALNIADASLPDIDGIRREGQPIHGDGPAAYHVTLPIEAMLQALRQHQVPARISNHAGAYLCNHCLYTTCDWAAGQQDAALAGFVHLLPATGSSDASPGMPIERSIEVVGWLLDSVATHIAALTPGPQREEQA